MSWNRSVLFAVAMCSAACIDEPAADSVAQSSLAGGLGFVVFRGTDNHLHQVAFNGTSWTNTDITGTLHIAAPVGNAVNCELGVDRVILYRGQNRHLHSVLDFNTGFGPDEDLTALAGGLGPAGDVRCVDPENGHPAIVYRSVDNHIHRMVFVAGWINEDLTALTGGPLAASDPTITNFGGTIAYVASGGHVHLLQVPLSTWVDTDLTTFTGSPIAAGAAWVYRIRLTPSTFRIGVAYRSADNHLRLLATDTSGNFQHEDLTSLLTSSLLTSDPMAYDVTNGFSTIFNPGTARILFHTADGAFRQLLEHPGTGGTLVRFHAPMYVETAANAPVTQPYGYSAPNANAGITLWRSADHHVHAVDDVSFHLLDDDLTALGGGIGAVDQVWGQMLF